MSFYPIASVAVLGGLLFGYDTGVIPVASIAIYVGSFAIGPSLSMRSSVWWRWRSLWAWFRRPRAIAWSRLNSTWIDAWLKNQFQRPTVLPRDVG
jgi:hypothetical protein